MAFRHKLTESHIPIIPASAPFIRRYVWIFRLTSGIVSRDSGNNSPSRTRLGLQYKGFRSRSCQIVM